ncbi:MAG: hypothetical protein JO339_08045 [Alphaproteobacteria bacterium]|nr:hypothetical protein [Alphaproteobacteria bacterium]
MFLGIDEKSGHVYEGIYRPEFPAVPSPVVTPAKLIRAPTDWDVLPAGLGHPAPWMFREDTFDPVTRTRRGRLYEPHSGTQPMARQAVVPHPYDDPNAELVGATGRRAKELWIYTASRSLLFEPRQGMGSTLVLGTHQAASSWRIIQTEVLAIGDIMVTLKSLSAFAILPDIDATKVSSEFRKPVTDEIERVLNSAFRETPISVVDHCRDAMTMLLSRWLVDQGHARAILADDLGKVAAAVAKPPHERECVSQLARVIARLHARGKTNEAHSKGLRLPVEEDAELALHALGFTLRDLGWAI